MKNEPWDRDTFTARLREVGASAYHDKHPFHVLMNQGKLAPEAVRIWVANRFYYQLNIPIKDAAILSNCPVREVRRIWLHRIVDHDGIREDEGGIGAWLRLGEACGLSRPALLKSTHVVPAVRFAVDAYVSFARTQPWPVAVASSLTELFAPDLMAKRIEAFEKFYQWIQPGGLEYFRSRLTQARRDSGEALELTLTYCGTRDAQEAAVSALKFKCDLLWAMLDGIHLAAFPRKSDSAQDAA
ncbi:MAG TPA: pyrroloquinoline-quinone synthase PqqC [Verrucomicrobiae bacterium]|nr:pyrroloquinoline-quinone synthase PqqC [Verrucomicrobiae bacterium]